MEITPVDVQLIINRSAHTENKFEHREEVHREQSFLLDQNVKEEIEETAKKTIASDKSEQNHINKDKENGSNAKGRGRNKKSKVQDETVTDKGKSKKARSNISIFDVSI